MDIYTELNKIVSSICQWLIENNIGSTSNKTEDVAWAILRPVMKHKFVYDDIHFIREKTKQDPFILQPGNLWKHLFEYFGNERYVQFFQDISELTPCGLNTSPNACCGKYELLYRLLRPNSRQPKRGDIEDNGEIQEIKGDEVRILDTELTGTRYKQNCKEIFEGHITPNTVSKGGLKGENVYEIEKKQYRQHYQTEFQKNIPLSKMKLYKYFNQNGWGDITDPELDSIIEDNGTWNQDKMNKVILKYMFIKYKKTKKFQKMYIFGDGTDVKIICDTEDLDKIQITADYFRINQPNPVGWYIK